MTVIHTEFDTKAQEGEAEGVLAILCAAYPGHPWGVLVRGGVIFIRHLEHGFNYGMNAHFKNINHDSAVFKREIIMMAGEWLERAGLVRGRDNGDEIMRVEGLPEKYQPDTQAKLLENMAVVMAEPDLRETPRPQVIKESNGN